MYDEIKTELLEEFPDLPEVDYSTLYSCFYKHMIENKMKQPPVAVTCGTSTSAYVDHWTFPPVTLSSYGSLACNSMPVALSTDSYCNKQEGNNPMNYATATVQAGTTETQDQRKYLSQRLEEIYWSLFRPLEATFGLTDDERPRTPKELKQRIADGKFTIKGLPEDDGEEDEDGYFYGGWTNMIRWRDPAKKADADGYSAAVKELQTLRQKTLDIIKIEDPKSGLDAIKALEAWTPTGAAN